MAEPARQRPLYPSEVTPLKKTAPFDGRPFDGRTDRQTDDHPSISPSKRPSMPTLSASDKRLVRWIETHVPGELAHELRPHQIQNHGANPGGFAGTRTFVTRYGAALITAALADMTYTTSDEFGKRRWWLDRIVSPAQFLHFQVKQFAAALE
jgi:hypothetical protein